MKPEVRRACVEALANVRPRPHTPIDLEVASNFLPLGSTRRAFAPEVAVVLGGRGTGKTAIFNVMGDEARRGEILAALDLELPGAMWLRLYSGGGPGEPEVNLLESLADLDDLELRAMWTALLTASLAANQPETPLPAPLGWLPDVDVNRPREWVPRARASFGELIAALDGFEAALGRRGATVYCCYDALDRISPFDQNLRRRHLRAILALWTSLVGRLRQIRPKIFLRTDLAEASELAFADASKLLSRAASLEWSHEELTRLLVRYLARSEAMRGWLGRVKGLTLEHDPHLGWLPGPMREAVRHAFTHRLVGPTVGSGIFQTESSRWILARMADARGEITPRTMLSLYGAAGVARLSRISELDGRSVRLLDVQDLTDALRSTSHGRVTELREDSPIVNRLLNLRHQHSRLPLPKSVAIECLASPSDAERGPRALDGAQVLDELIRLGAVSVHHLSGEDFVDVPDIYRIGLGIDIDYQGALGAFFNHGEAQFLQREGLHQLDSILSPLMSPEHYQQFGELASAARDRGDISAAAAVLEKMVEIALETQTGQPHGNGFGVLGLIDLGKLWLPWEPSIALDYLGMAQEILEEENLSPYRPFLRRWRDLIESQARVAMGETARARSLLEAVEQSAGDGRGAGDDLEADCLWAMAQISLREGHWSAALGAAEAMLDPEEVRWLVVWRGHLVLASLMLLTAADAPKITRGILPWSFDLTAIPSERRRDAALLSILPLVGGQIPEEQAHAVESTARLVLGDPKADLAALRAEAAERGDALIERVRAHVGGDGS